MRHAFLITAYKDPEGLAELIHALGEDARVFIHFDRRSKVPEEQLIRIRNIPTVQAFSRKYAVNWGGTHHLLAILELVRLALKHPQNQRLHLLTGSDRPLLPPHRLNEFFSEHGSDEFIQCFPLPTPYWSDGGLDRMRYYHMLDQLDTRQPRQRRVKEMILQLQKKFGLHRSFAMLPPLFGGSSYWSLTRECLRYVIDRCNDDPNLLRRFRMTHVPEEIFFQTLIMDSAFASRVVNDNLRYIDWKRRNGNNPAVLDLSDLTAIQVSGKLFARKIERPVSSELIAALERSRSKENGV